MGAMLLAGAAFLIVGAATAWACAPTTQVRATPSDGTAGSTIQVQGTGFAAADGPVNIFWGGRAGTLLATATADASGNFSTSATIPASASPGTHFMEAVQGSRSANFAFTVQAAEPAPAPPAPAPQPQPQPQPQPDPVVEQPTEPAPQPAGPQPIAEQPTEQPLATQPAGQPLAAQPSEQPATSPQPAAPQPAAPQPAASQPVASQPVASQPAASQPAVSQEPSVRQSLATGSAPSTATSSESAPSTTSTSTETQQADASAPAEASPATSSPASSPDVRALISGADGLDTAPAASVPPSEERVSQAVPAEGPATASTEGPSPWLLVPLVLLGVGISAVGIAAFAYEVRPARTKARR